MTTTAASAAATASAMAGFLLQAPDVVYKNGAQLDCARGDIRLVGVDRERHFERAGELS